MLIWMKETFILFNLQRDEIGNGLSNISDTFAESLQLQCQYCTKVCASSRLVSQVYMMAETLYAILHFVLTNHPFFIIADWIV